MPNTLVECWNRTVRARPKSPALIDAAAGQVWTRGSADALAEEWRARHGSGLAGRAVAFAAANGAGWLEVFLGLLKSGAVAVALDPGEPLSARRSTAAGVGASFLWNCGRLEPLGRKGSYRDARRVVKLTSGSSGRPRGLAFTDGQLLADGRHIRAAMGIRPDDINLGLIPFGHSYGLGNLVLPLLEQGTAVVCVDSALPQVVAATIEKWRPTVFPAVPPLLRALAETSVPPGRLGTLRTVISAGAPLSPQIAQAFYDRFGLKIHSFYGSSETGGITYDQTGDAALSGRSVGTPLAGVRITLGNGSRFVVESAAVFTLGNRHRHGATGSHSPADLARLGPAGELVLLGRTGRFVKIGGRRLNLAEVERSLRALPGVQDAFASPHAERADALAAAVMGNVTVDFIRTALLERLAQWKIPRKIAILPEFPLTARGKTDARRLREILAK